MVTKSTTSIFYSNKNYELAYKLKRICSELQINMHNAIDYTELVVQNIKLNVDIIIYDGNSLSNNLVDLSNFLKITNHSNVKVIFLDLQNVDCELLNNHYHASLSNICETLSKIKDEINVVKIKNEMEEIKDDEMNYEIGKELSMWGFKCAGSGYLFLKDVLRLVLIKGNTAFSLNSQIYPVVARKHRKSVENIERNIRSAIDKAWINYGQNHWCEFYKIFEIDNRRPTNKEFITMLADEMFANQLKQKRVNIR